MSLTPRDDKQVTDAQIEEALATLEPEIPSFVEESTEERLLKARERLKVKQGLTQKAKNGIKKVTMLFCGLVTLIVLAACGTLYVSYTNGDFYASRAVDERACRIKISDDYYLMGRRYFSYRYTDILGYRLVDTKGISERTELFLDSAEWIVIGHQEDGSYWREDWPKAEPGVLPLEDAKTYTVFSGKVAGSVTYSDFCKQFTKAHPFATLE